MQNLKKNKQSNETTEKESENSVNTGKHELSMGQVKFNDTPKVIDE